VTSDCRSLVPCPVGCAKCAFDQPFAALCGTSRELATHPCFGIIPITGQRVILRPCKSGWPRDDQTHSCIVSLRVKPGSKPQVTGRAMTGSLSRASSTNTRLMPYMCECSMAVRGPRSPLTRCCEEMNGIYRGESQIRSSSGRRGGA
jgi:hypothetical protein